MEEMIYSENHVIKVIDEGDYNGYHFVIVSYGTHPCAYVEIPYGMYIDDGDIKCHGGITYNGNLEHVLLEKKTNSYFIGWDYAHAGDYLGYRGHADLFGDDKKWTTEEIYNEVKNVIDQLKKMEVN